MLTIRGPLVSSLSKGKGKKPKSLSYEELCEKFSWLKAEEASAAYCNMPQPLTLEQKQAAEITTLKAQLASVTSLVANCKPLFTSEND